MSTFLTILCQLYGSIDMIGSKMLYQSPGASPEAQEGGAETRDIFTNTDTEQKNSTWNRSPGLKSNSVTNREPSAKQAQNGHVKIRQGHIKKTPSACGGTQQPNRDTRTRTTSKTEKVH